MKITIIVLTLFCVGIAMCAKIDVASSKFISDAGKPVHHDRKTKGHINAITSEETKIVSPTSRKDLNKEVHIRKPIEEKTSKKVPLFRDDYIYMEEYESFVKLNENPKPWSDAREYCEDEGASLAVITDDEEAKTIAAMMKRLPNNHAGVWVGLHDFFSDGEFVTIDGDPIDSEDVFSEWASNEPNNANGNEHCVMFYRNAKLNDVDCNSHYPFLCKRHAESLEFNIECDTIDPEYKLTPDGEQCFKLHTESKTWRDAFVTCKAEKGNLAILNSEEEVKLYTDAFETIPRESINEDTHKDAILVGFHELFKEHEYLTIDGKSLQEAGFSKWAKGQPDNPDTEKCGSVLRSGKLNDIDCDSKALFVCEKNAGARHEKPHKVEQRKRKHSTTSSKH